ncbi:MAG: tRNA uridine-5-carboxymethylaminomethyl(34) synthesis enzyme MnmG [Bacteroidota bacterium]
MFEEYDIIVVGAGHAGCEAAAAAANLGSKVLLITTDMTRFAQMSCNPAMGGIAKGQIVREIDALGGYSGIVTDRTMMQFRMLNRSKGPAMWSPRAQSDRMGFSEEWRIMLEKTLNIDFWQDMVNRIVVKKNKIAGVKTAMGLVIKCKIVVLTSGTFLNGIIHIGEKKFTGGRIGEGSVKGLTEQLNQLGFESGRMKTGTPPRVDGRSLDYSKMEEQKGDEIPGKFSFTGTKPLKKQKSCYITHTNEEVHEILRTGFARSPMFTGRIKSVGPRYCPSIEDKIDRFAGRPGHQLFIEPEGWNTIEMYVNGFSSSLPEEVQYYALRKIPGFKDVRMFKPGYAIEYDYFPPVQLSLTLETRIIENLFFAGQINGTTGYEEAACQGLMAGINAHLKINNSEPLILKRDEAYIGVLIDDLITKGTDEPYRMFTSRAEYRMLLRQDNADLRLTPKAYELGLASEERMENVKIKQRQTKEIINYFKKEDVEPKVINKKLEQLKTSPITQKTKLFNVFLRPEVTINDLLEVVPKLRNFFETFNKSLEESKEQAIIQMKYAGYIEKEKEIANKLSRLENIKFHDDFEYHCLRSLSTEAREKLSRIRPKTIGQASRISGVSPADISVLMVYMGR